MRYHYVWLLIWAALLAGCGGAEQASEVSTEVGESREITHATGFQITDFANHTEIRLADPTGSTDSITYVLYHKAGQQPHNKADALYIPVPVSRVVLTSTTDIPLLEAISEETSLAAFPQTKYIVSSRTRALIEADKVKELGGGEQLNTELLLNLAPDLVIGYSMGGKNQAYDLLKTAGVPVVLNGSWREQHPLGRAEWIKFVAAFYGKSAEAEAVFNRIRTEYEAATALLAQTEDRPKTIAGSLYKDVWYTPGGGSYMARYFTDAGLDYPWATTPDVGSLSLSLETVLSTTADAELWVASVTTPSATELFAQNDRYRLISPASRGRAFTSTKGKDEHGMPFYELGSLRADLVLKDLIRMGHPDLLPNYDLTFYEPIR